MTNTPDMEMKIIEAAIACIEKFGMKDATVRRIAQQANVNVAAINYYFHTKEQLMERVMEITLENAFDWSHFDWSNDYPPKPRLAAILEHMVTGTQAYPEITRVHFISPLVDKGCSTASYEVFTRFMEMVYDDLVARGAEPGDDLRTALIQAITASILGIGVHIGICVDFARQDLRDAAVRKKYIERLVDKVL